MKNYAKVGKRLGRPAYRTPASFRVRKSLEIKSIPKTKNARQSYGGEWSK
jgi:hypothetical protein